jgi:hypothetical protein
VGVLIFVPIKSVGYDVTPITFQNRIRDINFREAAPMKNMNALALALALGWLFSTAAPAQDEASDRAAILELIDQAFAAVASGDPDDWRAIQLAEGTTLSFRPDGKGG